MTIPGWRWCPLTLPELSARGAFGMAIENRCTVTQDGFRGTFHAVHITPIPGQTIKHSFNLYDQITSTVFAVADLSASDRGTGTFLELTAFQHNQSQSDWIDSIQSPVLIQEVELSRTESQETIAALVDFDRKENGLNTATYLGRIGMCFMDDGTTATYRSTAARIGWDGLSKQMPEWLRIGWSEESEWLIR